VGPWWRAKLTIILYWRIAANKNARTAIELPKTSFCNGLRMPNLARNGYRTELNDMFNNRANNGCMVCIWSGLISQSTPSILPFISVACNVHREPYVIVIVQQIIRTIQWLTPEIYFERGVEFSVSLSV